MVATSPLGEMDGAAIAITFDFDAEEPVELPEVGYFDMLSDLPLEGNNEGKRRSGDGAVVNVNNDDYGSVTIVTTVTIEHCLVHVASNKRQSLHKDFHELLVPTTTRLLQAV
jgi:hypothetical protein